MINLALTKKKKEKIYFFLQQKTHWNQSNQTINKLIYLLQKKLDFLICMKQIDKRTNGWILI